MKTTLTKQAEALKERVSNVSKKSKATIDSIIESNSKQLASATESNKTNFEALNSLLFENKIDPAIIDSVNNLIAKEVSLTEEIINSVIDSFSRQVNMNIDFASKFIDLVNSQKLYTSEGMSALVQLIRDNFALETEYSMNNFEKMISLYGTRLKNDMELGESVAESLTSQLMNISDNTNKGFASFFTWDEMLNPWWKSDGSTLKKA